MGATSNARDGAAQALGSRWVESLLRLDVLEAYEIRSGETTLGIGVARKRFDEEVRLLTYVVRPRNLDEVALLALRRPGRSAEVFTYITSQLYGRSMGGPQVGSVTRAASVPRALLLASASARAVELLVPIFAADYRFEAASFQARCEEPCTALRATPTTPPASGDPTEMRLWISERTGVALRREYWAEGTPLYSVSTPADAVLQIDDRWMASLQRVQTANGD